MNRTAKTAFEWSRECAYISNVTTRVVNSTPNALRNFNDDRDCFVRYCQMQQKHMNEDGFFDSAEYVGHCLNDLGVQS